VSCGGKDQNMDSNSICFIKIAALFTRLNGRRRERARERAGDKERESERKRGVRDGEREGTGGEGEGVWGGKRQKE